MKKKETLAQALTRQLKAVKAKCQEQEDDNTAQRRLIERLSLLHKDYKDQLPDVFCNLCSGYINEYERRFTFIGKNQKSTHPVFRKEQE